MFAAFAATEQAIAGRFLLMLECGVCGIMIPLAAGNTAG
jgi:hypothetical protein